ncbi:MAG TPA: hypothetical protein VLU47_14730 [Blastocatellia bacterium]|nr:hypothetical protein [Blastocatellia bacterium]
MRGTAKEIDIKVQGNQIAPRSPRRPREGWEDSFRQMASKGDDRLHGCELLKTTRWDEEEWRW